MIGRGKKYRSILYKILDIVFIGSLLAAVLVFFVFFFALVNNDVPEEVAWKYALGSTLFLVLCWFVGPILIIQLLIEWTILRPIKEMTKRLEKMSEGDLDTPLEIQGRYLEINRLAESFERMRLSLKALIRRLKKHES
ncbi:HAMP domain-containing protein [Hydrogenivirga caldilitoris]|uniref:histidine kinase n=1 Tax=Hydrogenivirga caldilitoris TaxID=246264 RepID=A0A497XSA3_9AQUI|nr:HAMP domain-containing protein [Hydrogenivirga caldilitoris]RLJ69803.1 HAMP domain-containing protein [Hydrogenivirga caldilitoris]